MVSIERTCVHIQQADTTQYSCMNLHYADTHMRDSSIPCHVHTLGRQAGAYQYLLVHRKAYMSSKDGA